MNIAVFQTFPFDTCRVLYCVCVCVNIVSSCHVMAPLALQWLSVISCEIWGTCSSDWKSELICWSSCCRCLIWSKPFKALQINTLHNLTAPQTDGFLPLPGLEYNMKTGLYCDLICIYDSNVSNNCACIDMYMIFHTPSYCVHIV